MIIISVLSQTIQAQNLKAFRNDAAQSERKYIELTEEIDGQLNIFSNVEAYSTLTKEQKATIFGNLLSKYTGKTFIVRNGYERELWLVEVNIPTPKLIDRWNMNTADMKTYSPVSVERSSNNPWFFYFGGEYTSDLDINTNAAVNSRIGFFLLKNVWDLALSGSIGINDNSEQSTAYGDVGLNTRVYFPMKGKNLSPYIGVGISWYSSTTSVYSSTDYSFEDYNSRSISYPLSVGVSWFIGPGSLDIGFQYSKERGCSSSVGYTLRPGMFKKRR